MSCVTENRDALSANNFALEDRSPDKSFMYIKNNNGLKMKPWGTPTVTFCHSDVWPFRRTFCFLSLKKLDKRSKNLPDIPFYDTILPDIRFCLCKIINFNIYMYDEVSVNLHFTWDLGRIFLNKKNIEQLNKMTTFIFGLYIQFIYNKVTFLRRLKLFFLNSGC